jgi:hypothetical protein
VSGGVLRGGPEVCPAQCSECEGGNHHWIDVAPDPDDAADERLTHPAYVNHDLPSWYECKHCSAWSEDAAVEEEW